MELTKHAGCTKSSIPELAKPRKPPKLQFFKITFKLLEGFKNGEIETCLRLDTQDHDPEVMS